MWRILGLCLSLSVGAIELGPISTRMCTQQDCGKYMVWAHVGPEGTPDQMMVVVTVAMQFEAVLSNSVTAMYGATDMAEAAYYPVGGPGGLGTRAIKIFYLFQRHIPLGLQQIKIDWPGIANKPQDFVLAGVVTYYGVEQSMIGKVFGDNKATVQSNVGNILQDMVLFSTDISPQPTGTLLWLNQSSVAQAGAQYKPGAASVLMEWQPFGPTGVYVAAGIEILKTNGTRAPTTAIPSTKNPTLAPSTQAPTTAAPTTLAPSTPVPTPLSLAPTLAPTPSPSSVTTLQPTTGPSTGPPTSSIPTTSPSLAPTHPPTEAPTEAASDSGVIRTVLIVVSILAVIVFAGGAYYICKLKRRVYTAEELFLAPSDFARLMHNQSSDDADPDAQDFSQSRPSHSTASSNFASTHF